MKHYNVKHTKKDKIRYSLKIITVCLLYGKSEKLVFLCCMFIVDVEGLCLNKKHRSRMHCFAELRTRVRELRLESDSSRHLDDLRLVAQKT
jgi:hypothetical protein